ncbi:MAG: hypothetical protein KDA65_11950 [Planctomycetaceae bacterium]|nr:hypothetical protein [Planctomycetaceae bacterium]
MPSQLFYSNFDFEYQLRDGYQPTPKLKRLNEELAFCWLALVEPGDQILLEHDVEPEFLEHLQQAGIVCPQFVSDSSQFSVAHCQPWGWSQQACRFAETLGHKPEIPDPLVIHQINNRLWAAEQEAFNASSERISWIIASQKDLEAALVEFQSDEPWLLKTCFSMSGRDRISGQGTGLTEAQMGWVRKRLHPNSPLLLERYLQSIQELGLQYEVPPEGEPVLMGLLPMLTDRTGRYAGSWILQPSELIRTWQPLVDQADSIAKRIQAAGYFGPVGLDVMQYRDHAGDAQVRLFQDVNARYTMGRLALGWSRYLKPKEVACWLHLSHRCQNKEELKKWWAVREQIADNGARLIRTSPLFHAGQIVGHQTGLLITNDETRAREQVQRILSCV